MKRLLIIGLGCLSASMAMAQADQPKIIETFRSYQMSGNGEWMLGRSNTWLDEDNGYYSVETSICNVRTGEIYGLADLFTFNPFSRPIASNGMAVISTYDEVSNGLEVPFLIVPGEEPKPLVQLYNSGPYAGKECYTYAITDDATAFLAYYEIYPKQIPFVCAINPDHSIGEPEFLPLPPTDIFGNEPFMVEVSCISDDAKTAAGLVSAVVPGLGTISYPIVYRKSESGKWSYYFPLEELYEEIDPENVTNFYTPQIALSPDGTKMALTQEVPNKITDQYDDYIVWTLDLAAGTYKVIESQNPDVIATRILNDGTVVGTFYASITVSYIYTPGADDFVDFVEFVSSKNPSYGEWMKDNLMVLVQDYTPSGELVTVEMPNTGEIYVSDDLSVFGAGFQTTEYDQYYNPVRWSYVFTDFETSGVQAATATATAKDLTVYNMQGLRIGTLTDESAISSLPKGLYIIGGKKVLVK